MAAVHVSESEAMREFPQLLARVEQGDEIVIERNTAPLAILTQPRPARPSFEETVERLRSLSHRHLDDGFAHDVQTGIDANREPHTYPAWD